MRSRIHSYKQLCSQENKCALTNNSCCNAGEMRASAISVRAGDCDGIDVILSASKVARRQQDYCHYSYVARRGFLNYRMLFKNPSTSFRNLQTRFESRERVFQEDGPAELEL